MEKELTLQEIQAASLDVLIFFDKICNKLNLHYFLAYGTLIGAVRHNGFIPWDDDLDVWMLRKDMEILRDYCFEHEEEMRPYKYCCRENTTNYPYYIPRISNQNYRFATKSRGNVSPEIGAFIDIYPLDNYGRSIEEGRKLEKRISKINTFYIVYIDGKSHTNGIRSIFKQIAHIYMHLVYGNSYHLKVNQKINRLISKNTNSEDRFIGVPAWETYKIIYPKDIFSESIMCSFENHQFPIPKHYDEILKMTYGDYLKLPPEEKRIPHHKYHMYINEGVNY